MSKTILKGQMMNRTMRLSPWVLALNLGLVSMTAGAAYAQTPAPVAAPAAEVAPAQAVPGAEAPEAAVVLGNTSGAEEAAPVATEAVAAEATPTAEKTPEPKVAEAEPVKDPREVYRDRLLQTPEVMPASTSAASRRYRKVDLSAYRAMMQNNAPAPVR